MTDFDSVDDGTVEVDPEALADAGPPGSDTSDLERDRDELRALAQRVQADFENFRKQAQRREVEIREQANAALVEQLLTVIDTFELALSSLGGADEKVRKGVELAFADLVSVLEKAGLERIPTDGARFDPEIHDAVMHDGGDGDPTVVETMRTGYRLKGRVLRPAMVKVAG